MSAVDAYPRITSEDDWLELADGERAIVCGRIEHSGPNGTLIGFRDWTRLLIDGEAPELTKQIGEDVTIEVERHDDGVRFVQAAGAANETEAA